MTIDSEHPTTEDPPALPPRRDGGEPSPPGLGVVSVESLPYLFGPVPARRGPSPTTLAWFGGLAALVVVLLVGAWGIAQRDAAADARNQSLVWQTEAERLTGDSTTTQEDLDAAERRATGLAAEVEGLRTRLAEASTELEQAGAVNLLGAGERDALRQLAQRGPEVGFEMSRCADAQRELADRALRATADPGTAQPALDEAAATARQTCADAQRSLTALERSVADLG